MVGRALVAQAGVRFTGDALGESCCKPGLADPRLARDQYNLPFALPSAALALQQEIDLCLAADEIGQIRHADCLEATLGGRHALDHPCRDRLGYTLDLMAAQVAQTEQIAEQSASGGGDDDRPRLGQCLKAGCEVRRLPDQSMLPQPTLAAEIADHHQAGGNANAHCERFCGARLEPRNSSNNIECRPYGSLGIVFVCARIAEIGQYPVAAKIPDEAVIG